MVWLVIVMCVCACVCVCGCVCVCVRLPARVCMCMCLCVSLCTCVHLRARVCMRMCVLYPNVFVLNFVWCGLQVADKFYVTYNGKKLAEPYRSAVSNALTAVLVCRDVISDDTQPEDIWS